jgi:hypothetical protein
MLEVLAQVGLFFMCLMVAVSFAAFVTAVALWLTDTRDGFD